MVIKDINENDKNLALSNSELNQFRWGMREALARKNASNIWGNSFCFSHKKIRLLKSLID